MREGSADEAQAYIEELRWRTVDLLKQPRVWAGVVAMVSVLAEGKPIQARYSADIMQHAAW